jgi:phosphocarrier protein
VKAVKQWRSQIRVENLDTRSAIVDAKNLMRVVSLGAKQGHRLHFMASGKMPIRRWRLSVRPLMPD